MIRTAIRHRSFYPFVQPLARDRAIFLLEAAKEDLSLCRMLWWKRSTPEIRYLADMSVRYSDAELSQWHTQICFPETAHYIKYCFFIRDRQGRCFRLDARGLSETDTDEDLFSVNRAADSPYLSSLPDGGCFEVLQINPTDLLRVPDWAAGAVYYQIFPERFRKDTHRETTLDGTERLDAWNAAPTRDNYLGGTLKGIHEKLPYIKELGADCIYLNPIFRGDFNHKYATTDYFEVDPMFGTKEELNALVSAAHKAGLRVILDGVFNHTGIHFAPFADWLEKGDKSAFADWFYPLGEKRAISADCYECVGDYPYMPRLNGSCPGVRAYVKEVLLYWLRTAGIDGWRLDVADELDRHALSYWAEEVKKEFPQALLLGETWGDASLLTAPGGTDTAMNYLFRDCMTAYFAAGTLNETGLACRLYNMLMRYPDAVNHAMFNLLGSHDTPRFLTLCGESKEKLRMAAAFQMMFIGAPSVYYGDEAGMTGDNDPGCRGGMNWDTPDTGLTEYIKQLTGIRKAHIAVRTGSFRILEANDNEHMFAFERVYENDRVLAVFNSDSRSHTTDFAGTAGSVDVPPLSVKIITNP